jgi:hypothetical protein
VKKTFVLSLAFLAVAFHSAYSYAANTWVSNGTYHQIAWLDIRTTLHYQDGVGDLAGSAGEGFCLFAIQGVTDIRFYMKIEDTPLSKAMLSKLLAAKSTGEGISLFIVTDHLGTSNIWPITAIEEAR